MSDTQQKVSLRPVNIKKVTGLEGIRLIEVKQFGRCLGRRFGWAWREMGEKLYVGNFPTKGSAMEAGFRNINHWSTLQRARSYENEKKTHEAPIKQKALWKDSLEDTQEKHAFPADAWRVPNLAETAKILDRKIDRTPGAR